MSQVIVKISHGKIFQVILLVIIGATLFMSMYSNVKPEKLDVTPFSIAEQTIRSPFTVEDEENTEKKRKEASEQVQDVYVVNQDLVKNQVDLVSSIFDAIIDVKDEVQELIENSQTMDDEEAKTVREPSMAEKISMLKEKLPDSIMNDLSHSTITSLLNATKSQLIIAKDTTITAVNHAMTRRIPADQVENSKKRVEDEIRLTALANDIKNASIELGRYAIIQNEFYDPVKTEELRKQAVESVEPVRILQGQIIVEQGQLVSNEIYRQLQLLGLLKTDYSVKPFVGVIIFILIMVSFLYFYFRDGNKMEKNKPNELIIFSFIFIISLILMKMLSLIQPSSFEVTFIFPAAMGAMLLKILLNERISIISTILLAAVSTIIFNNESSGSFHITAGLYVLFSGISGLLFLTKENHRSKIFQAGLFVSAINIILIIALLFIPNSQLTNLQYGNYLLMGLGSGVGSAVLTIGFLPFFEAGFGILSTMKLIELSNPNHPLLKKILTEAPGTYHHSVMVANLADAACSAIGANGLLARVGCYYHDIGKTVRPNFFIENQMNITNPHDNLSPEVSKDIIVSHVTDGVEILQKNRMPQEIIDIAKQHHGTTLIKYFYYKAKESGQDVNENEYRYPGPKPQTKESAIVSIADSVEAAVRSMTDPNQEKIEQLVTSIITDRINDQQLNECDITLKELEIIGQTLCETLHGIFHNRIKYPEMEKEKGKGQ